MLRLLGFHPDTASERYMHVFLFLSFCDCWCVLGDYGNHAQERHACGAVLTLDLRLCRCHVCPVAGRDARRCASARICWGGDGALSLRHLASEYPARHTAAAVESPNQSGRCHRQPHWPVADHCHDAEITDVGAFPWGPRPTAWHATGHWPAPLFRLYAAV